MVFSTCHIQGNHNCGYNSHSTVKPNELELEEALGPIIYVSPKFSPLSCISHSEGCGLPFCEDDKAALWRGPHGGHLGILQQVCNTSKRWVLYASQSFR